MYNHGLYKHKFGDLGYHFGVYTKHPYFYLIDLSIIKTLASSNYNCGRIACWLACPPHAAGCGFASRPGDTKDHDRNGTDFLPAWHAGFKLGFGQCSPKGQVVLWNNCL